MGGGPTASMGSVIDLVASLEAELRQLLTASGVASAVVGSAASHTGKASGQALTSVLGMLESSGFAAAFRDALAEAESPETDGKGKGLARELERLGESERRLEQGLKDLAARADRFEEAMLELAETQSRCLAKLESNGGVERVRERLDTFEQDFEDFRGAHKSNTHGVLEGFEGVRARLSKLEAGGSDMARQARARSGRIDALSRHLASVERKLDAALGAGRSPKEARLRTAVPAPGKTVQAGG